MHLSTRSKTLAVIAALLGLSACADYTNHWDSITLGAGNAPEANAAIQSVEPFPPDADNTTIPVPGERL
jgi:hypothetical protein